MLQLLLFFYPFHPYYLSRVSTSSFHSELACKFLLKGDKRKVYVYDIPQGTRYFITFKMHFEFLIKILRGDTGLA